MSKAGDSSESPSESKGQPESGLTQSILLEQSSVNRAILEGLERLAYDDTYQEVDFYGESGDGEPPPINI